jgi:methylphosphotriester-DNA--protein-cysteine methyltransferase
MAIADRILGVITKYQGGGDKVLSTELKDFPGTAGDKIMKEYAQRRNGGVDGSPMGQEGMKIILPRKSSLKWAFRKITNGNVSWYALMVWDQRGYFIPISPSRLAENVEVYDDEAEPAEDGTRPTRRAYTNEFGGDDSPKAWQGPDQMKSLENYLDKHGNKVLDLETIHQYQGPSQDRTQDFARKTWDYTTSEDKAAYEESTLYIIENWPELVKKLTKEEREKVEKAIVAAGMDPATVLAV